MPNPGTVKTKDVLVSRNWGLVQSGLAGLPVYQSWAHAIMPERIIGKLYAAEDTGFFKRQWEHIHGRDTQFIDLIHDIHRYGVREGITGWPLATKFLVQNGHHRVATAHALGLEDIEVAEAYPIDPVSKDGRDLTGVYAALDAVPKRKPIPNYAYNAIRGRHSIRQSEDRLKLILEAIVTARGHTLLDLGCSDGYFGVALACFFFDVTFVDYVSSFLEVVKQKLAVTKLRGEVIEDDAVQFLNNADPFSVILCTDVFDQVIHRDGLEKACTFLSMLIAKADSYLIFTPGKWARCIKHGFDQRKMYEIVRDSGKRMKYLGRDGDKIHDYGRELFCIY